MDLLPYADRLQRDVLSAARAGGEEAVSLAELLGPALESSSRLVLLDALVEAAAELNRELASSAVDVRLRGREVDLVVTSTEPAVTPATAATPEPADDADDGGTARLSLRLPERLKPRIEEAADAAGLSVNAWLVRTVAAAVADRPAPTPPPLVTGQRHLGWAR